MYISIRKIEYFHFVFAPSCKDPVPSHSPVQRAVVGSTDLA